MTTAHRPTFDPARGKEIQRGPAYHQRLQPAHTALKVRQTGQGTSAESGARDLRAELLAAEEAHYKKINGIATTSAERGITDGEDSRAKRGRLEDKITPGDGDGDGDDEESPDTKRRRILEESRDVDADSASGSEGDENDKDDESSSEDDSDEDETAELMRELEKIKRERAEQKAKEEAERAAQAKEQREEDIALGNPLLNSKAFNVKRRWDDDVVFKNQARGTEQKGQKEFVNDLLRSDFHKKFMSKYVR